MVVAVEDKHDFSKDDCLGISLKVKIAVVDINLICPKVTSKVRP